MIVFFGISKFFTESQLINMQIMRKADGAPFGINNIHSDKWP